MTLALLEPRTEPRRPAPLPPEPAQTAARPPLPELVSPDEPGLPAAHASPRAWAAPGTPEALVERRLAAANAAVADPAARIARALCVFAACAQDHPEAMRCIARGFSGSAAAQSLRFDIADGQVCGRFPATGLSAAALAAVGVAQIALTSALECGPKAVALTRELAFGLLRALGLPDSVADEISRDAAREILALP